MGNKSLKMKLANTNKKEKKHQKSAQKPLRKMLGNWALVKKGLLVLSTLVSLGRSQLTVSVDELSKNYPTDYDEWNVQDDRYSVPANTKNIMIESLHFYPLSFSGNDYDTFGSGVWQEFLPMVFIEFNKVANTGSAKAVPFIKIFPSLMRSPAGTGGHLADLRFEVYDESGTLIVSSPTLRSVNDFSGVYFDDWRAMDHEEVRFDLKIELNPLKIVLQAWLEISQSSGNNEDILTWYKPLIVETGAPYDFDFDELTQVRINYNQLFPADMSAAPPVKILETRIKSTVVTGPSLVGSTFEDRYYELHADFFAQGATTMNQANYTKLLEFDMRPDSFFTVDFFDEANGFKTARSSSLLPGDDYLDTDTYLLCRGNIQKSCRYVRNLEDGSYSLYLSQDSQGLEIHFDGDGDDCRPGYTPFNEFYCNDVQKKRGFNSNDIVGEIHSRTNIIYFSLQKEVGMHICDQNSIIKSEQILITFDKEGQVYIGEELTSLTVESGKWYALGTTWLGDIRELRNGEAHQKILLILTDLATSTTSQASFEGEIPFNRMEYAIVGGRSCGAEMMVKYYMWTSQALAPYDPANTCPGNIPFQLINRFDGSLPKTCLATLMIDNSGLSTTVFDQETSLVRTDPSNCPNNWMVLGSSGCECVSGTLLVDGNCECPVKGQYFDNKRNFCTSCPVGYRVDDSGGSCEVFIKPERTFQYFFDENSKEINIYFEDGYPEEFTSSDFKKYIVLQVEDYVNGQDYGFSAVFEQDSKTIRIIFDPKPEFDYKKITFVLTALEYDIKPELAQMSTGPDNKRLSAFNAVSQKISSEAVQSTESIVLFGIVAFPPALEDIPFIFTFFSFLRTLNYYPVKLPENLHNFLKLFYVDYRRTWGYRILVKMGQSPNPPLLRIRNREGIYVSKILYFSNTIPVVSFISKIALIWYLVKWFKKARKATLEDVRKEMIKLKTESCFETVLTYLFRKFMTFLIIKIHVYIYGRLVFIFAAFQGFNQVLEYNTAVGIINIFEGIFDFTVIVWIELKIYDFLVSKKSRIQLMMLDIADLKSILMIDVFYMKKDKTHSATYLCLVNICLFFLSVTLVIFQNFVELLFIVHILVFLGLVSFTFLARKRFKKTIYFFVYMINNLGFALVTIFFSFFMYYTEFDASTNARNGFIVTLIIIMMMITKLLFFVTKSIVDFVSYQKRRKNLKRIKQRGSKFGIIRSNEKLSVDKVKTKKVRSGTKDVLGENNNNQGRSSLLKFVMNKRMGNNEQVAGKKNFIKKGIRENAGDSKKKLSRGLSGRIEAAHDFESIRSSRLGSQGWDSNRGSSNRGSSGKRGSPYGSKFDAEQSHLVSGEENVESAQFSRSKREINLAELEVNSSERNLKGLTKSGSRRMSMRLRNKGRFEGKKMSRFKKEM